MLVVYSENRTEDRRWTIVCGAAVKALFVCVPDAVAGSLYFDVVWITHHDGINKWENSQAEFSFGMNNL